MLFNTELTNKSVPCVIYMLWFNFTPGLNFIFFCFWVW